MENHKELLQAHGMTVAEMKELALKQSGKSSEPIKMIRGNRTSKLKDRYFIEQGFQNYELPEHEKNIFHVAQETRSFHPVSGEKLSQGMVQKYDATTFEFMINHHGFAGKVVQILHDPRISEANVKPIKPGLTGDGLL